MVDLENARDTPVLCWTWSNNPIKWMKHISFFYGEKKKQKNIIVLDRIKIEKEMNEM